METTLTVIAVVAAFAVGLGIFATIHPYETLRQKKTVTLIFKVVGGLLIGCMLAGIIAVRQLIPTPSQTQFPTIQQ